MQVVIKQVPMTVTAGLSQRERAPGRTRQLLRPGSRGRWPPHRQVHRPWSTFSMKPLHGV